LEIRWAVRISHREQRRADLRKGEERKMGIGWGGEGRRSRGGGCCEGRGGGRQEGSSGSGEEMNEMGIGGC
jgi:hypothetical protein